MFAMAVYDLHVILSKNISERKHFVVWAHTHIIDKKRVAPLSVVKRPEYDSHDIGRSKKAASDTSAVTSVFGVLYVLIMPASNGTFFLGLLAESLLVNASELESKGKVHLSV